MLYLINFEINFNILFYFNISFILKLKLFYQMHKILNKFSKLTQQIYDYK